MPNSTIRVLTIVGTRPEAIKLAPVINELGKHAPDVESIVCATAQHRELLDQMLEALEIRCHHDLDVMVPDQGLSETAARILTRLDDVVSRVKPDWMLTQGDTTTVAAASLVAFHRQVRLGHVEAGLRTGDKSQPFPEEMNRRIADTLSDLHFAPTVRCRDNLLREGLGPESIVVTGNTVVDALLATVAALKNARAEAALPPDGRKLLLVTMHRRENIGSRLHGICQALLSVARRYRDTVRIVYPVHPNPNVRGPVHQLLGGDPNISLIEPVGYKEFVRLMMTAHLILTDSGGLQEEAPSLRVPVLVLRDVTERPEGVAAGVVKVVGTAHDGIVDAVCGLMDDQQAYRAMASGVNPYGDGRASERIVAAIRERHTIGRPA